MKAFNRLGLGLLMGAAVLAANTTAAIPHAVKKVDTGVRTVFVKTGHALKTVGKDTGKAAKVTGHDTKIGLLAAAGWN